MEVINIASWNTLMEISWFILMIFFCLIYSCKEVTRVLLISACNRGKKSMKISLMASRCKNLNVMWKFNAISRLHGSRAREIRSHNITYLIISSMASSTSSSWKAYRNWCKHYYRGGELWLMVIEWIFKRFYHNKIFLTWIKKSEQEC